MRSSQVQTLLAEFSSREQAAKTAGDFAAYTAWKEAWQLLHEANHQSELESIRAASARKLARIRARKTPA